jgi:hypothetical protein
MDTTECRVPKRNEVTGGWRGLHYEEPHKMYLSPSIIILINSRKVKWEGHVARVEEKRNAYKNLVERQERKRPQRKKNK